MNVTAPRRRQRWWRALCLACLSSACATSPSSTPAKQTETAPPAAHDAEASKRDTPVASSASSADVYGWVASWEQALASHHIDCWADANCAPLSLTWPSSSTLQAVVDDNDSPRRRAAAASVLQASFILELQAHQEELQQNVLVDDDAMFLLADLPQLLTQHGPAKASALLAKAEPALARQHQAWATARQAKSLTTMTYAQWRAAAAGVSGDALSRWAQAMLDGTADLKTSAPSAAQTLMAAWRQPASALSTPLVDDGRAQQAGLPRCVSTSSSPVRFALPKTPTLALVEEDVAARATCAARRRRSSLQWADAMGAIARRQAQPEGLRKWRARLLAASVLALAQDDLHAAAEEAARKALFAGDDVKGLSFWLQLTPSGVVERAFVAHVIGGAVDHIMSVRHGSQWPAKLKRDDVQSTLQQLEQALQKGGIDQLFALAGETAPSPALWLARL